MDTWDSEWQERQQQIDAVERDDKYAAEDAAEGEALKQAVSKASDWAWDAVKPVIDEYANSMAKAVIAEKTEAPSDVLDMMVNRLGVEADDEWLIEAIGRSARHIDVVDTVSDAVYHAVLNALDGNE